MSLAALFLLVSIPNPSTQAAIIPCDKPLKEIVLKMKVAEENLAVANQPAIPGMWPAPAKVVECRNEKCKVRYKSGFKLSYEPFSFYADHFGLVGYPDIDPKEESIRLASLEWAYEFQKNSCDR